MPRNEDRTRKDLEILGLEISASEDDKKKAFIKLALKLHPDRFNKNPDDVTKMKFHEVCKAYKRLTTDQSNTSDWNVDKSDEIFFSLLADSLQHSSKAALFGLFSELPNHKSHFQNDNEYRIKEDVIDDEEDDETEVNRLVAILMNRLQNGKSLPAGLTQDRICKLKEDFIKQKEASKHFVEDEQVTSVGKKPKPQVQVPVTKPKPKSKKQILAEQRRREREMAKIAAELDEKKKRDEEKENARKQLESEKQRKLEEEQKKLEEEKKRYALDAKKKKDREDKEREQRLQKENERLDKLKKQQEEELKRKEEEKKRKTEEKAAKSKAAREAKEREEKDKLEQAKKQGNKRTQAPTQQAYQSQYPQYQQQQQKYPREVPPRFLRQMQQRQPPGAAVQSDTDDTQHQQTKSQLNRKDDKVVSGEPDWDAETSDSPSSVEKANVSRVAWTEAASAGNENWGQELSNSAGSLSDWGNVTGTEDWDETAPDPNYSNWTNRQKSIGDVLQDNNDKDALRNNELSSVGTIGSEVKSGKIPKKDIPVSVEPSENITASTNGQFGVIGQPIYTSSSQPFDTKLSVSSNDKLEESISATLQRMETKQSESIVNKSIDKDLVYQDLIEQNKGNSVVGQPVRVSKNSQIGSTAETSITIDKLCGKSDTPSPKLTGWSGLDPFDPLPSTTHSTASSKILAPKVTEANRTIEKNVEHFNAVDDKGLERSQPVLPQQTSKEGMPDKITADRLVSQTTSSLATAVSREVDEYGWTTASSKKTKQKSTVQSTGTKDANVWLSRPLKQLLDMGFKREAAERALKENNGSIENAVSDLLTKTDVVEKTHMEGSSMPKNNVSGVFNDYSNRPITDEQDVDETTTSSVTGNTSDVSGSPNRLNRKQRRKQVQEKSAEGRQMIDPTRQELNKPSDLDRNNFAQTVAEQRPTSFDILLENDANSTVTSQDSSFVPTSLDTNSSKGKSIGVIGSPLPGISTVRPNTSHPHSTPGITEVMSHSLLNSLDMNKFVQSQVPHLMMQTNPPSSAQHPNMHHFATTGNSASVPLSMQHNTMACFPSDSQSVSSQNAALQYLMQQQHQMAHMGVTSSQSHGQIDSLRQQHFQQQPQDPQQPNVANVHSTLPSQPFISAKLSSSLPSAPQKSKLHQWTQSRNSEDALSSGNQSEQVSSSWSSSASSIGAPVTVDPVSAKWGVIAAPRLSPTPCEFKPGVPWKPKGERADRTPSDVEDRGSIQYVDHDNLLSTGNLDDTKRDTEKAVTASTVRPPPGLNNVNAFGITTSSNIEANGGGLLEVRTSEVSATNRIVKPWLSLFGLKPTVDHKSLRMICQQYGMLLAYKMAPNFALVHYENPAQAQDARNGFDGQTLFECMIKAELLSEDDIAQDIAAINSHSLPSKSFVSNQYPTVPPRSFWETNGPMRGMTPNMNSNIPTFTPQSGLPQAGMLERTPRLGLWGVGRPGPVMTPSAFWPMNARPQGLLSQVPGYGPWSETSNPSLGAANVSSHAAVSPSTSTKLLPDGLFNGSESM